MSKKSIMVYYAHPMSLYGTPQEQRDIKTLNDLGFKVVNPSDDWVQERCGSEMHKYLGIVRSCQALAFRSFPGGDISAGVGAEIEYAKKHGLPVIELPSRVSVRILTRAATCEFLSELGER